MIVLTATVAAQTAAPPQTIPPPPPGIQRPAAPPQTEQQKSEPSKPETKVTPQQAQELFRAVDEILQFVSKDTGLPIKHEVKRQLASREQVQRYIQSKLDDDEDAKRLQRSEVVLRKFGLVPRDFNLRGFLVDLLKEQVAGYYDAKTKTVYLLDWVEPEQQKPVLAHELTHALQDQNFGLEKLGKSAHKDDPTGMEEDERLAARQAVIEGQGMIVLMDYMLAPQGMSVADAPTLVDAMQAGLTSASPDMVMFNRAPLFLQQLLLFPYKYGTLFTRDVLVAGGKQKAFGSALENPPRDTRQVMQPATYLHDEFVTPLRPVDFEKLARDYKKWDLGAMGEFDVYLLLKQFAKEQAEEFSKHWRGGYYWAARTPGAAKNDKAEPDTKDIALTYVSRWATADSAAKFAKIYSDAVPKRYASAKRAGQKGWNTPEGQVSIDQRGDTVLVLESFDPQPAQRITDAVFGAK